MFLTAVILILFFSLSDLAKWMNQNGDTYALREFIKSGKTVYADLLRYRVQK